MRAHVKLQMLPKRISLSLPARNVQQFKSLRKQVMLLDKGANIEAIYNYGLTSL